MKKYNQKERVQKRIIYCMFQDNMSTVPYKTIAEEECVHIDYVKTIEDELYSIRYMITETRDDIAFEYKADIHKLDVLLLDRERKIQELTKKLREIKEVLA